MLFCVEKNDEGKNRENVELETRVRRREKFHLRKLRERKKKEEKDSETEIGREKRRATDKR